MPKTPRKMHMYDKVKIDTLVFGNVVRGRAFNSFNFSFVFGDILHNKCIIGYFLCNMKSSSCTQPFTEYICPVSKHYIYRIFLCVLSPSFKIVVLGKRTLKFKKLYTCYICTYFKMYYKWTYWCYFR